MATLLQRRCQGISEPSASNGRAGAFTEDMLMSPDGLLLWLWHRTTSIQTLSSLHFNRVE